MASPRNCEKYEEVFEPFKAQLLELKIRWQILLRKTVNQQGRDEENNRPQKSKSPIKRPTSGVNASLETDEKFLSGLVGLIEAMTAAVEYTEEVIVASVQTLQHSLAQVSDMTGDEVSQEYTSVDGTGDSHGFSKQQKRQRPGTSNSSQSEFGVFPRLAQNNNGLTVRKLSDRLRCNDLQRRFGSRRSSNYPYAAGPERPSDARYGESESCHSLIKGIQDEILNLLRSSEDLMSRQQQLFNSISHFQRVPEVEWMNWLDAIIAQLKATTGGCTSFCALKWQVTADIKELLIIETALRNSGSHSTFLSKKDGSSCYDKHNSYTHNYDKLNLVTVMQTNQHRSALQNRPEHLKMGVLHHMAYLYSRVLCQTHRLGEDLAGRQENLGDGDNASSIPVVAQVSVVQRPSMITSCPRPTNSLRTRGLHKALSPLVVHNEPWITSGRNNKPVQGNESRPHLSELSDTIWLTERYGAAMESPREPDWLGSGGGLASPFCDDLFPPRSWAVLEAECSSLMGDWRRLGYELWSNSCNSNEILPKELLLGLCSSLHDCMARVVAEMQIQKQLWRLATKYTYAAQKITKRQECISNPFLITANNTLRGGRSQQGRLHSPDSADEQEDRLYATRHECPRALATADALIACHRDTFFKLCVSLEAPSHSLTYRGVHKMSEMLQTAMQRSKLLVCARPTTARLDSSSKSQLKEAARDQMAHELAYHHSTALKIIHQLAMEAAKELSEQIEL